MTKPKGKRWKKGHSCVSNPQINKHREAAKNRFFHHQTGSSNLTVTALEKHDAKEVDRSMEIDNDAATFKTWATNYTECTNATFNRVHNNWSTSNDVMHKEVLAVLAAVTEIIKSQGGEETEVEYFAILMTTIETADDINSLTATVYLLSLVIKRVPKGILQAKFGDITKIFVSLITKYANSDGTAILTKLISCLVSVLKVQDMATWSLPSAMDIYKGILEFASFQKPKVRKIVRESVAIILRGSDILKNDSSIVHPAAPLTQKYCTEYIEKATNDAITIKSKRVGQCSEMLHMLHLMKDVMPAFPRHNLKSACETVLRLMSLNSIVLKGVCLEVLNTMFHMQPSIERLTPDINAKIITALYDFLPNPRDTQMMPAWLLVMENAHINLARIDSELCLSHLPRIVNSCIKCLSSDVRENITAGSVTLKSLTLGSFSHMCSELLVKEGCEMDSSLCKIVDALGATLGFQYHTCWNLSLQCIGAIIEAIGSSCPQLIAQLLPEMSALRDNRDFSYKADLDSAMGKAVATVGPKCVLQAIPILFSANGADVERSWLMPILKVHIADTELAFFQQYFLPLATKCRDLVQQHKNSGNVIQEKVMDVFVHQIWSLLAGFCTRPTDLLQSFKNIAKTLGQVISEHSDLRRYALSGLRKLISSSLGEENEVYIAELAKYSKNYLPILFNVFTSEALQSRHSSDQQCVLDTIREYLQITDRQLINTFFDKCISKLEDTEEMPVLKRNCMMDLGINMVEYVDAERIAKICKFVEPIIEGKDKTLQKKGYRFLENICAMKSETSADFVTNHLDSIQKMLLDNLAKSSPSSKGPRLRCLIHLFKMMEIEQADFLTSVLPEAILCTAEIGSAARRAAFELLVTMCEAMIQWRDGMLEVAAPEFISLLMAGLAGSPQMVRCTLLALTRLLFEYRKSLSTDSITETMNQCCMLLKSKSREVIPPALSLLKVSIGCFDVTALATHLKMICESLSYMKEENKHHFRFKVKEILERLVRKFGIETISKLMPEQYEKQLNHIRKMQARKKREKADLHSDDEEEDDGEGLLDHVKKSRPDDVDELLRDTDSEMEDDNEKHNSKSKQKKHPSTLPAWLRDDKDEITDFLDPSASKNVVASKPASTKQVVHKSREAGDIFKIAPDGRMLIEEEKPRKIEGQAEVGDIDAIFEEFEANLMGKKGVKRKMFDKMESSASQVSTSTYKSGGRGIHRPLDKAKKAKKEEQVHTGAEYKAKNAQGDMKRKNRPDPYAYVPLNVSSLNKRKSAKMKGQFKNLVGGAKKGATRGKKAKAGIRKRSKS